MLAILTLFMIGCSKDDSTDSPSPKLETIKFMAMQSDKAFSGALEIFPCTENTTHYVGNYNHNTVSVINPSCLVSKGSITNWGYQLFLPIGTYNMIYWGIANTTSYSASRSKAPAIRLGNDMSTLYWSLVQNSDKTTYMPVWDQVMAVQDVHVGDSDISVNLMRKVAGLNVVIKNSDGTAFDPAITSFEVLVGGIAEKINVATGLPENQTKTVRILLTANSTRTIASNVTAMLYPSSASPDITINIKLGNGQSKTYTTKLKNAFEANSMQTITVLTSDIMGSTESGFTIDDWNETSQTIDIPIL